MADTIVKLQETTLEKMASEVRSYEAGMKLKDLATSAGANYAIYETAFVVPGEGIKIQPKNGMPPQGSTLICDGMLKLVPNAIEVEAFRLAAEEDDDSEEVEPAGDEADGYAADGDEGGDGDDAGAETEPDADSDDGETDAEDGAADEGGDADDPVT